MWRAHGTRRPCGEGRRLRGSRQISRPRRAALSTTGGLSPASRRSAGGWTSSTSARVSLSQRGARQRPPRAARRDSAGARSSSTVWRWARCRKRAARPRTPSADRARPSSARLGVGALRADADALRVSERAAFACADGVIVTSAHGSAPRLGVWRRPQIALTVVEPGVDPAPRARVSVAPAVALLAVGAVSPRKGYDVLAAACADAC